MTFKDWFDDMQERYLAYYGGYEELLQEAFEAGAKQEREACAKTVEKIETYEKIEKACFKFAAKNIRARNEA